MARYRIDDVSALFAGRRVAVSGEILEGEVGRGMVGRGAGGFTAVVQGVEFVRRGAGRSWWRSTSPRRRIPPASPRGSRH